MLEENLTVVSKIKNSLSGFPGGSVVKNSPAGKKDSVLDPGRSHRVLEPVSGNKRKHCHEKPERRREGAAPLAAAGDGLCTTVRTHQSSCSVVSDSAIANSRSLLKLMSTESLMPSTHFILSRPLLLLPSIFPSIRVFSNESVLRIRWPKYWCFSFRISPSNEYSGLISLGIAQFDLLAVQGTLKSLLQHHSHKY